MMPQGRIVMLVDRLVALESSNARTALALSTLTVAFAAQSAAQIAVAC